MGGWLGREAAALAALAFAAAGFAACSSPAPQPPSGAPASASVVSTSPITAPTSVASASPNDEPISPCTHDKKIVQSVQWSPDGRFLLTTSPGSFDGATNPDGTLVDPSRARPTIDVWNLAEGKHATTIEAADVDSGLPPLIDWTPDATTLVFGGGQTGAKESVRLFDTTTWLAKTAGEIATPTDIAVSRDGRFAAVSSSDGQFLLVDIGKKKALPRALQPQLFDHPRVGISFDGSTVMTMGGGGFGPLSLRKAPQLREIKSWAPCAGDGDPVPLSPKQDTLAVITPTSAEIVDARRGSLVRTLSGTTPAMNEGCRVAFSPDGRRLAAQTEQGLLMVWDVETGAILGTAQSALVALSWDPTSRFLFAGTSIWSADGGLKAVRELDGFLAWVGPGKAATVAGRLLRVVDVVANEPVGPDVVVTDMPPGTQFVFSPDQRFVAALLTGFDGSASSVVRLMRLGDGKRIELAALRSKTAPGIAADDTGGFQGPIEAAGCVRRSRSAVRAAPDLLKQFVEESRAKP